MRVHTTIYFAGISLGLTGDYTPGKGESYLNPPESSEFCIEAIYIENTGHNLFEFFSCLKVGDEPAPDYFASLALEQLDSEEL